MKFLRNYNILLKGVISIGVLVGICVIIIYFIGSMKKGDLITIETALPHIGDSIYLSYQEYLPPLETLDGSPKNEGDIMSWMLLDQKQYANTLKYDQYKKLCTPEFLSSTEMNAALYEEMMKLAKANRKKSGAAVKEEVHYFITAEVNSMQFGAVCSVLQGLRNYRFFKKTGAQWKYDVHNYPENPFSVLPYSELEAIKEMMAVGKAKIDDDGKLRPINDAITSGLP